MQNRRASFGLALAGLLALAAGSLAFQPGTSPKEDPKADPATTRQPGERRGPRQANPGEGRNGEGQRGGDVEGAMKQMNRALKQLREQVADATKLDDNLRLVNDIQRGCATAKGLGVPEGTLAKAKDAAAKAALSSEYRKDLIAAMRTLLDIEESLASGKVDDARAKLDVLAEMREKSHKEMGVED